MTALKSKKVLLLTVVATIAGLVTGGSINAATIQYEYDALNRLTRVTYDDGTKIVYSYDPSGNRSQRISTLVADASGDGAVDWQDFCMVANRWLDENCDYTDGWCDGADVDWNTKVDFEDLALMSHQWLSSLH